MPVLSTVILNQLVVEEVEVNVVPRGVSEPRGDGPVWMLLIKKKLPGSLETPLPSYPPPTGNLGGNLPRTLPAHPCDGGRGGEFPPGLLYFPQILVLVEQVLSGQGME